MSSLIIDNNIVKEFNNLKKFILKYKTPVICSIIFTLICFGFMLTNHSLTIDEETWITSNSTSNIHLWLMQGRFGIFLLDKIFAPTGNYIPFLWDFLAVVLWNFSGICFIFCISMYYPKFNKFSVFVFCSYFSSLPLVVGELLSYSMFNFQQSIGMLFMSISSILIYIYFSNRKIKYIIFSSIFLFAATSIYQAFMVVYIVMVLAYLLIKLLKDNNMKALKTIAPAGFPFLFGVAIYYVINKIITTYVAPDPNNYINGYIGWNKGRSALHVILSTFHFIEKILLGDSAVYGSKVLLIITFLFFIYIVVYAIKIKGSSKKLYFVIISLFLLISPFALSIVLGMSGINGRTYVALPLAGSIELLFIITSSINYKKFYSIIVLISIAVLFLNSMYMNRLFYNSFMVYESDTNVGNQLIHDISLSGYDYSKEPIVFIGMHSVDENIFSANSGSTGGSFFSWDDGNNARMINFLRSEGYNVSLATPDQIKTGYEDSKELTPWPSKNSIKQINNCIVVKLSIPTKLWFSVNGVK